MTERIVVGVDGSAHAKAALRWALAECRLRGAQLDAVIAWQFPYVTDISGMAAAANAQFDLEGGAHKLLDDAVDEVLLATGEDVRVHRLVREGAAARVLLDAAEGASLLVVGSRGHGGFAGLLLGSVSQQVVHHALCPVVIVRD